MPWWREGEKIAQNAFKSPGVFLMGSQCVTHRYQRSRQRLRAKSHDGVQPVFDASVTIEKNGGWCPLFIDSRGADLLGGGK